jgi:hypothetical protein
LEKVAPTIIEKVLTVEAKTFIGEIDVVTHLLVLITSKPAQSSKVGRIRGKMPQFDAQAAATICVAHTRNREPWSRMMCSVENLVRG